MCRCVSIMPGITMPLRASISLAPSGLSRLGPTFSIRSPITRTSASCNTSWASFMVSTVPPRSTIGSLISLPSSLIRNDDQLGSVLGRLLAFPRAGDVIEGNDLFVDHDLAVGHVPRELGVCVALDVRRRVRDREPAYAQRHAPDRGGAQRDLGPGELADLDVAGVAGRLFHCRFGGLAPQSVDGHVDRAAELRLIGERYDLIGAPHAACVAGCRDHLAGAEELRGLRRNAPERAV